MRITNKMLANNFLSDMTANLNNMQKMQRQLSTGKEFAKPSDNPFAVARSMQMNSEIDANKQYNSNIKDTINWLDTTDTALGQINNVFQGIREKLVAAGNAGYGPDDRQKIKDEINQRVSQISQILNTNFDGEYIFGGSRGTTKPVDTKSDGTNTTLIYNSKDASELSTPVQSGIVTASNITNWSGKTISFKVDGVTSPVDITLGSSTKIEDLITDINQKIASNNDLKGKVAARQTDDGRVAFNAQLDQNSKAYNISISDTVTISGISDSIKGKAIPSLQAESEFNTIASKRAIEISQGVTVDYNVNAADIMSFKDKSGNSYDLRDVLKTIVSDLGDSTKTDDLTNTDLTNLDAAMANLLKVRSEVGAKGNRMDSAQAQNEQANQDMTEILSKTEDIDITEKTMEYATMQTVYLAGLQTSAKVLQPTLMDYMS